MALFPLLLALQVAAGQQDALRYDITLVPADTGRHLLGEVETAWRLTSSDPVAVQLDSSLRVVRVLIDGRPNTRLSRTMYGRSIDDLVVPHEKPAGDSITTRIRYHGLARAGAKVGTNRRGERIFFAVGRGDSARYWLPVPLGASPGRITASYRIQVPVADRALAPGVLEQIDTLPYGHAVWRYRMDAPAAIASLAVAAGPYRARSLTPGRCGDGCPQVEVWSYDSAAGSSGSLARAWEIVEFFAERVGRYPYPRLVHAEAPVATALGAPGLIFHPEGSMAGAGPADSTVALETARQWFGQAIAPASPEDAWITGGLARYLASLWSYRSSRPRQPVTAAAVSEEHRGENAMGRLRKATGDSAFFSGLRRFTADRLHQSASRADFLRAMSAAAGRDLDRDLQQAYGRAR